MPAGASRHALYGRCTEEAAAWAIARQRPQAVAPYVTPVSIRSTLSTGTMCYVPVIKLSRPALQRRMIAENACADVVELDTDHTPHLSMTSELAQALHQFAAHSFR